MCVSASVHLEWTQKSGNVFNLFFFFSLLLHVILFVCVSLSASIRRRRTFHSFSFVCFSYFWCLFVCLLLFIWFWYTRIIIILNSHSGNGLSRDAAILIPCNFMYFIYVVSITFLRVANTLEIFAFFSFHCFSVHRREITFHKYVYPENCLRWPYINCRWALAILNHRIFPLDKH